MPGTRTVRVTTRPVGAVLANRTSVTGESTVVSAAAATSSTSGRVAVALDLSCGGGGLLPHADSAIAMIARIDRWCSTSRWSANLRDVATIRGSVRVTCSRCDRASQCTLVQTIGPDDKPRLYAGELNVLDCACGCRTQLAAQVLYKQDGLWIQVCPGGDDAMEAGIAAFAASGVSGMLRVVPSLNALVEKLKIADAGLADWAIEMMKVLLVAPDGDLDRVLLFDALDGDAIRWLRFDGDALQALATPRAGYDKLAIRTPPSELRIDRAWAVGAVKQMIEGIN
jgi:hypothetical protein